MAKVSVSPTNDYCPQTLFLYGTNKEDGTPNFGLFCWFSYCWLDDLGVMACISGSKLTLERIRKTKAFSANLVTEKLLPLADYCGTAAGFDGDKLGAAFACERGKVLDVPVLSDSPVAFELTVERMIPLNDPDTEVLLCRVENVLMDETLQAEGESFEEKLRRIAPIRTTCQTYFGWDGHTLGAWHEPGKSVKSAL